MTGINVQLDVSVAFDSSSITFKLSNQAAIKIKHEKELLAKTYMEAVRGYLPSGVNLPSVVDKFEDRFKALCRCAERRYRSLKGRAKATFLAKERSLTIDLQPKSGSDQRTNQEVIKDIIIRALEDDLWRLQSLTEKSINELKENVHAFEAQCLQLRDQNSQLRLQAQQSALGLNKGKMVGEGCSKTDNRKLQDAGSSVLRALEAILETYGLSVCQLLVSDIKGFLHNIAYQENGDIVVTKKVKNGFPRCRQVHYNLLPSPDKKSVREVAALLDNHFVSNVFWKELAATVPNLPPMQLVSSYRAKLDARISVFKTPGEYPGAQVDFEDDLRQAVLELAAERKVSTRDFATEKLLVKIEGDGCVVSRSTSWTTLSFLIIDKARSLQCHRLHRLLAVVEGSEKYFNIRDSFRNLIDDINAVAERGSISVNDHNVNICICLGSDLKFLLVVQGLQAASSRYPCPFCRADAKERSAAGASSNQYNEPPLVRTYANMRQDCTNDKNGMKNVPLFSIDPSLVIPDVLHMRIRIVNRLLDGLLAEGEDHDNRENVQNPGGTTSQLNSIVAAINSCGVKFEVWTEERKGRTFTSLPGGDCQTLLQLLPDRLRGKLDSRTEAMTLLLWKLLHEILEHFENNTDGHSVQTKASHFLDTFVKLGSQGCKGYGPDRVTPYIHILVHHASSKHEEFNCLGWFSSQGIEKKNDVLKHLHHSRSNKWNSAADALKLTKRLEANEHNRNSRVYTKQDVDYWSGGGIQENRSKRPRCAEESSREPNPAPCVDEMDAGQLRTELRAIGISTAVKAVDKLRGMLKREQKKRFLQL